MTFVTPCRVVAKERIPRNGLPVRACYSERKKKMK